MNILNSKSLINHNTFKVNANAKFFINVKSENDIIELLKEKKFKAYKKFILGGGSNILFTKDINGIVIHNQIKGIDITKETKNEIVVEIGAGEIWDEVVSWSVKNNLYGIENLSLIPGYAGAAPIQNIGAYGSELKDVFLELKAINIETTKNSTFNKSDCQFGYRNSIFKNKLKGMFIITRLKLVLSKDKKINISYKALSEEFKNTNTKELSCKNIREKIIKIRRSKLPDPEKIGNAGSFFKNPIISEKTLSKLQTTYAEIPFFKKNGEIKIPAAWLIEKCKWKGYAEKTCGVYHKHALILINRGDATGKEILKLANKIKKDIYKNFNITLEEEVNIS